MRSLIALLALAGCAATPLGPTPEREALTRDLAQRVAGEPRSCVSATPAQGLTVVDERTIAYHSGATIWLNHLRSACPSLRPPVTLIVEMHGSQYCRGDTVRAQPLHSSIPGPICVLGDFVPYRAR